MVSGAKKLFAILREWYWGKEGNQETYKLGNVRIDGHPTPNLPSTAGSHVGNAAPIFISRTSLHETGIISNLNSNAIWNCT